MVLYVKKRRRRNERRKRKVGRGVIGVMGLEMGTRGNSSRLMDLTDISLHSHIHQ